MRGRACGETSAAGSDSAIGKIRMREPEWPWVRRCWSGWKSSWRSIPERLERLHKAGLKKISRTDPDSRFLRERGGFTLGYTVDLAVSEDHVIFAQRVTQHTNDNESLLPMVQAVEHRPCHNRRKIIAALAAAGTAPTPEFSSCLQIVKSHPNSQTPGTARKTPPIIVSPHSESHRRHP